MRANELGAGIARLQAKKKAVARTPRQQRQRAVRGVAAVARALGRKKRLIKAPGWQFKAHNGRF